MIAGVLVALGTLVLAGDALWGDSAGDQSHRPAIESSPTSGVPGTLPADSTTTSEAPVECRIDGQPSDCAQAHNEQLLPSSECNEAAVLDFLGGDAYDVLLSGIVPDAANGCTMRFPHAVVGDAGGALQRAEGAALRRCLEASTDDEIGCDQPHAVEVVAVGDNASDQSACEAVAEEYVAQPLASILRQVEISRRVLDGEAACLLMVRPGSQLTGSVRDLGTDAWPVQPVS